MPEITVNGRRIAYRDEGTGAATVIALHCSSSHSGQWKPLIAVLEGRARVLAPDLHGYGRSEALPEDGQPWFAHDAAMVAALAGLADGPVHIVGHSLGGATGFYTAVRAPGRFASLTMIEPVLFTLLAEAGDPTWSEAEFIGPLVRRLVAAGETGRAAREFTTFWSGEGSFERMPPPLQDYVEATIGRVAADWAGMEPELAGQATAAQAAALDLPVHLLAGGETRASARQIVGLLAAHLPRATRTDIPGVDHMGAVTRPDLVMGPVLDWLGPHLSVRRGISDVSRTRRREG